MWYIYLYMQAHFNCKFNIPYRSTKYYKHKRKFISNQLGTQWNDKVFGTHPHQQEQPHRFWKSRNVYKLLASSKRSHKLFYIQVYICHVCLPETKYKCLSEDTEPFTRGTFRSKQFYPTSSSFITCSQSDDEVVSCPTPISPFRSSCDYSELYSSSEHNSASASSHKFFTRGSLAAFLPHL
jgi:hypothetical protein